MRLINTTTCEFKEFNDSKVPPYAILSHTWSKTEAEVSYQDYIRSTHRKKESFVKIAKTLEIARENGIGFAWIDSCCIDKRNSAELTEAINSMYRYYEQSKVCYTFLFDLKADGDLSMDLPPCYWFTRGWTLQELVAPLAVHFYDGDWRYRGSKESLSSLLSQISGIDEDILLHRRPLRAICVAQKMAWASSRSTTRSEDVSYSLLGIFGVNMPLLYGEGKRAFRRLQEEIIKSSSDLSILAWTVPVGQYDPEITSQLHCGVLAESPASFAASLSIHAWPGISPVGECTVTNRGIRLDSPLRLVTDKSATCTMSYYVLPLYCTSAFGEQLGIRLRKIGDESFMRTDPCALTKWGNNEDWTFARRLRYLALETPYLPSAENAPKQTIAEKSLIRIRHHILKLHFTDNITNTEYFGCAYDHADSSFFDSSGQSRGWVAFKFTPKMVSTPLWLFITGWTSGSERDLEWWLIDTNSFAKQVAELQRKFENWDCDGIDISLFIQAKRIPECRRIQVPVPDTCLKSCVWIEYQKTDDPARCRQPFWTFCIHQKVTENTFPSFSGQRT